MIQVIAGNITINEKFITIIHRCRIKLSMFNLDGQYLYSLVLTQNNDNLLIKNTNIYDKNVDENNDDLKKFIIVCQIYENEIYITGLYPKGIFIYDLEGKLQRKIKNIKFYSDNLFGSFVNKMSKENNYLTHIRNINFYKNKAIVVTHYNVLLIK
jgi:hypothetical protein